MAQFTMTRLRSQFYHHDQLDFACLDFKFNNVELTAFYDRDENSLLFVKKKSNLELEITIDKYFNVNDHLATEDFYLLIKMLELGYSTEHKFIPKSFFKEFDDNFAWRENLSTFEKRYLNVRRNLEDPDAIYYDRRIDHRGKNNGHVTQRNRDKVKRYFPKLYAHIKDKDISIGFTSENKHATQPTQEEIIEQIER